MTTVFYLTVLLDSMLDIYMTGRKGYLYLPGHRYGVFKEKLFDWERTPLKVTLCY